MLDRAYNVLFLCTGNSARSILVFSYASAFVCSNVSVDASINIRRVHT
jgi:protein-tyrosine-phosphatase